MCAGWFRIQQCRYFIAEGISIKQGKQATYVAKIGNTRERLEAFRKKVEKVVDLTIHRRQNPRGVDL